MCNQLHSTQLKVIEKADTIFMLNKYTYPGDTWHFMPKANMKCVKHYK